EMQENVKKCKNFLATLIKLASHNSPSPETSRNVKALVQDLLDAKIEPEEFTNRLQTELKSSPQPYLVPFLKKSLPALRLSLLNSQQSLIQTQQPAQLQQAKPTPSSQPVSLSTGTVPTIAGGPTVKISQPNTTTTTSLPNVLQHTQVGVHSHSSPLTIKRQPGLQTTPRMPMVITQSIRTQGLFLNSKTNVVMQTFTCCFLNRLVFTSCNDSNYNNYRTVSSTGKKIFTLLNNRSLFGNSGGQLMPTLLVVFLFSFFFFFSGTVGKAPVIQASKGPGGFAVQVSANQKNKLNDPGGGSFRDDDDINDVASMAGVNLNEESARILATNSDLVGTQIRSCKDEAFIPPGLLHKRILETAKKFGVTEVPVDAVNFISHATQERLRTVLEKVTIIAQHRMETCKDDEWLEQGSDVRSQLKFFEQLERLEKQRKDEQEREILLKAAKSRSRQEDPEQARLKQKAKEMQQQELAQMRQRDANLTALAAIGPRKKRKLDSPGAAAAGAEVSGSSSGSPSGSAASSSRQYSRQRITRVNLRDFIFYMEEERETSHSLLLYRALLK
ncbi:TAF4 factor, partial [Polyodon spathula]|nr:TAF4 factor [Polyodon spathula]